MLGVLALEPPHSPVCLWGRGLLPTTRGCLRLEEMAWPLAAQVCGVGGVWGSWRQALSGGGQAGFPPPPESGTFPRLLSLLKPGRKHQLECLSTPPTWSEKSHF